MEEIIKQLQKTIKVYLTVNGSIIENETEEEVEVNGLYVNFHVKTSGYITPYVPPSRDMLQPPEGEELEITDMEVYDLSIYCEDLQDYPISKEDTELLIKEIKERVDYEY